MDKYAKEKLNLAFKEFPEGLYFASFNPGSESRLHMELVGTEIEANNYLGDGKILYALNPKQLQQMEKRFNYIGYDLNALQNVMNQYILNPKPVEENRTELYKGEIRKSA